MDSRVLPIIQRIDEIDALIEEAYRLENAYELQVLMKERGSSITQLCEMNVPIHLEYLIPIWKRTDAFSERLQILSAKYEHAIQSVILSSAAKRAYSVAMSLQPSRH